MLKRASALLGTASGLVSMALEQEEDALDNMPENLQYSERHEKMESTIDLLNDASDCIDGAIEKLGEAVV